MEFLIVTAMVIILLVLLGFGFGQIASIFMAVLGICIVLTGLFFLFCLVLLIFSKREKGFFVEFDESRKFSCPVYEVNGTRLRNLFPGEMVLKNKLYVPEKKIHIRRCRFIKSVIDKNAMLTIIFGSAVFIPGAVFSIVEALNIIFGVTVL